MSEDAKRRVWTKEKVALLGEYLDKGLTGGEISKLLDTSRNAIIGKTHRLGRRLSEGKPRPPQRPRTSKKQPHVPTVEAPPIAATAPLPLPVLPEEPPRIAYGHWPLLELPDRACRWPCEREDGLHLFCGKPPVERKAYCAGHCRMAGPKYY